MFAFPLCERHVFYHAFEDVCVEYRSSCALNTLSPVAFAYLADRAQSSAGFEPEMIQKNSVVDLNVVSLGTFLCTVQYGPTERLSTTCIGPGCKGGPAFLHLPSSAIKL